MTQSVYEDLKNAILFEDDAIIVLNKPPGWVVNDAASYKGPTIQGFMRERLGISAQATEVTMTAGSTDDERDEQYAYGTPGEIFAQRDGVVHRLDKDTSGILLLAKTPTVLFELLRQFREREVQKTYVALVHGKLSPSSGIIRLPMARSSRDFSKFDVSVHGKVSETHYTVLSHYPHRPQGISEKKAKSYQGFSLVELAPKTGRTHQIRVHLSALHHPIVGDEVYAGKKRAVVDKEWCPRQFLHAKRLAFTHPVSGENVTFEAPLTQDLEAVLRRLTTEKE